jgi:hypothetical protein
MFVPSQVSQSNVYQVPASTVVCQLSAFHKLRLFYMIYFQYLGHPICSIFIFVCSFQQTYAGTWRKKLMLTFVSVLLFLLVNLCPLPRSKDSYTCTLDVGVHCLLTSLHPLIQVILPKPCPRILYMYTVKLHCKVQYTHTLSAGNLCNNINSVGCTTGSNVNLSNHHR